MKVTGSLMWNFEPSGKVMNVEVVSRKGILKSHHESLVTIVR